MRRKLFAAIGLAALLASGASAAIYTENFEALADGELNGQGGWTTVDGLSLVSNDGFMSTRFIGGILAGGAATIHYASHAISMVGQTGQITLSYDAFGLSALDADGEYSHNSGAGLGFSSTTIAAGWIADFGNKWIFDASGLTGNSGDKETVWLGFGKLAKFEVVIDRALGTVFGRYAFTDGASGETAHFTIGDVGDIDQLTSLTIQQDLSLQNERTGVDLDNFNLTAGPASVPEPFTMALGGAGAWVAIRRMRRKPRQV